MRHVLRALAFLGSLGLLVTLYISTAHAGEQWHRPGEFAEREPVGCWDNLNRYVDCHNGTYTDTESGLVWLKDPSCFNLVDYATANRSAAKLRSGECGLTDGSQPGDWRLPTLTEFESLFTDYCDWTRSSIDVGVGCDIYGDVLWAGYPAKYRSRFNSSSPVGFWTSTTAPPFYPGSNDYTKDCGSVNGQLNGINSAACAFYEAFGRHGPLLKTDTADASVWPVRRVP